MNTSQTKNVLAYDLIDTFPAGEASVALNSSRMSSNFFRLIIA